MKNLVHEYDENLMWRMLFVNITKILCEEFCLWILWKSYMKNLVHEYYENLIWRMFMNITKILYEECSSWILWKSYVKIVLHEYYENLMWRILFMNITKISLWRMLFMNIMKILCEECCSWINKIMNILLKLFYLNNQTKQINKA